MLRLDWNLLFTVINLVVLYLLMKKVLIGPVNAVMDARKEMIESKLAEASKTTEDANKIKSDYETSLGKAKEEAVAIVEQAKKNAGAEYEAMIQKGHEEAAKIIRNAEKATELQREKTMQDIEGEIAALAMAAAAKIVAEQADTERDKNLYNQFIQKSGDMNDGAGN